MSPNITLLLKISVGLLLFSIVAYVGWRLEKTHKETSAQEVVVSNIEEEQEVIDSKFN